MGFWDMFSTRRTRTSMMFMGEQFVMANPKAWESAEVRETVDAIARHAAKLKPVHMRGDQIVHGDLEQLMQVRPNVYMSAFDMLYKLVAQLQLSNNAFLYLDRRGGVLRGIYPVDFVDVQCEEDARGLMIRSTLLNGKLFYADYGDLIHIRRHFVQRPVLGAANEPLDSVTELVNTFNAGTMSSVKNGTRIRGVLKTIKKAINETDLRRKRNAFIEDLVDDEQTHGVAALDSDQEYTQLDTTKLYTIRAEERKEIVDHVYKYFGVNEKIVNATYNEDEWNAFYESVLEPIAVQLSLEFTAKLLTSDQRASGEKIVFEANRLQYASANTKINMVNKLGMLGSVTHNEVRAVFNLPPRPDGDTLIENWNAKGVTENAETE